MYGRLDDEAWQGPPLPLTANLQYVLETAFFASLAREEGRSLRFVLCCAPTTEILRDGSSEVVERVIEAGAEITQERPLGLSFPPGVFSLSHVALPFPPSDGLYGFDPDTADDFGIRLGAVAPRGEVGALIVSLDTLLRMSSNPFFSYLLARIEEGLGRAPRSAEAPR